MNFKIPIRIEMGQPDQFLLGIQVCYGEDESGSFHMISIGFLFFSINLMRYFQ